MNETLIEYLDDFCIVYLDNILIYLEDPVQYKEHVYKVLLRLYKVGL
jgi:hypothetical protein